MCTDFLSLCLCLSLPLSLSAAVSLCLCIFGEQVYLIPAECQSQVLSFNSLTFSSPNNDPTYFPENNLYWLLAQDNFFVFYHHSPFPSLLS